MRKRWSEGSTEEAIERLGKEFGGLNWDFRRDPSGRKNDLISHWLGRPEEDEMVCVYKGRRYTEPFHRQEFFFFNFAYSGDYDALSAEHDNRITIREGDCYIGQPYSGYAIRGRGDQEAVIVGVLIRKEVFFREYLGILSADKAMYRFFLEPRKNRFADEFIRLTFPDEAPVWPLLDVMMREYVRSEEAGEARSEALKTLAASLMIYTAAQYHRQYGSGEDMSTAEKMVYYIESHSEKVTLADLSSEFGYHPNYISSMLRSETGRSFSEILLEKRMEKAEILLRNTDMTVESVAETIGYGNTGNFYKAYRSYFGTTPREHVR
jgi:AraC-like DNA-binding protein